MAQHNRLGREGEDAAAGYLVEHGYHIVERNWRFHRYEIDIIAQKDGTLAIIEVKTRRNDFFISPEESVTDMKMQHIMACADAYVRSHGINMPVRLDIITVIGTRAPYRINHIEDAFYPR